MPVEKAVTIRIYGRVQGVFMRSTLREWAETLDITGYAKNEPDGSVFVFAQGAEGPITNFINYCKQGSEMARIYKIEVNDTEPQEFDSFIIRS